MYSQAIFLMFLVASAGALVTPRASVDLQRRHQHAALAKARAAAPEPLAEPLGPGTPNIQLRKRCKARNSTSVASANPPKATLSSPQGAPVNVASDPASVHAVPPAPSPPPPPPAPAPPSKALPPAPPSPPASSGGGQSSVITSTKQGGDGTFYATGLGACGFVNHDTDFIAAASKLLFDTFPGSNGNPNDNPICGKKVGVTFEGKSVTVAITDRCEACAHDSLDFSPSAFTMLAPLDVGRIHGITWHFL